MRVLGLVRQPVGSAATLSEALVEPLWDAGVELVVDQAEPWIPDATGPRVDREVSKALKAAAKGFDLVHAFGYRSAWACSEAFYLRFPWVFSALDLPKTTHPELVDRLNSGRRGLCPSRAVREVLDRADALNLEIVVPGVRPPEGLPDQAGARAALGWPDGGWVVGGLGRGVPERGLGSLVASMGRLWDEDPGARLELSVAGPVRPASEDPRVRVSGPAADRWAFLRAVDLLVVPSPRAGFSLAAAEAMALGTPVLLLDGGGLSEMGTPGASVFVFRDEAALGGALAELRGQELRLEAAGNAGRVQAAERFGLDRFARDLVRVYRDVLGG